MDTLTRDDLGHSLSQLLGFYGKKLDPVALRFWMGAFDGREPAIVKAAMEAYTKIGKFAPKPVDILGLMDSKRAENRAYQAKIAPPDPLVTNCPKHIELAWRWFIPMMAAGSNLLAEFMPKIPVDAETQEKYLLIVNQQAKLYNTPEAIPDEFKLREVWG